MYIQQWAEYHYTIPIHAGYKCGEDSSYFLLDAFYCCLLAKYCERAGDDLPANRARADGSGMDEVLAVYTGCMKQCEDVQSRLRRLS